LKLPVRDGPEPSCACPAFTFHLTVDFTCTLGRETSPSIPPLPSPLLPAAPFTFLHPTDHLRPPASGARCGAPAARLQRGPLAWRRGTNVANRRVDPPRRCCARRCSPRRRLALRLGQSVGRAGDGTYRTHARVGRASCGVVVERGGKLRHRSSALTREGLPSVARRRNELETIGRCCRRQSRASGETLSARWGVSLAGRQCFLGLLGLFLGCLRARRASAARARRGGRQ